MLQRLRAEVGHASFVGLVPRFLRGYRIALSTLVDRGFKQTLYLKSKKKEQLHRLEKAQFSVPLQPF